LLEFHSSLFVVQLTERTCSVLIASPQNNASAPMERRCVTILSRSRRCFALQDKRCPRVGW